MDLNIVNVTGQVTGKSYKNFSWGDALSIRVALHPTEFFMGDAPVVVTGQELWVDVSHPRKGQTPDKQKVQHFLDKIDRGCVHVAVIDATFDSYLNKKTGATKNKLKASFSRVWLSTDPFNRHNSCMISGDVTEQQPHYAKLKVTYNNPRGKTPAEKWKHRLVPVTIPFRAPAYGRRRVLVTGQLATKDGQGREFLSIVATEII